MYCFFYRKRKVRNKTTDSVILLREENQKKGKNRCKTCHLIGHRAAGCPLNAPKPRYEMVHSHKKIVYSL